MKIARQIREELKQETAHLKSGHNVVPGLRPSWWVRIRVDQLRYRKQKISKELGFYSVQDNQPENISRGAARADREVQQGPPN